MRNLRVHSLLALLPALAGCDGGKRAAPVATVQSYEVRGEIVRLPPAGGRDVVIRHVAIPGFVDERGRKIGMEAMTMPFPLADGVAVEGFSPGDPVAFTLEVEWASDSEPIRITRIAKMELIERLDMESGETPPVLSGDADEAGEAAPKAQPGETSR